MGIEVVCECGKASSGMNSMDAMTWKIEMYSFGGVLNGKRVGWS